MLPQKSCRYCALLTEAEVCADCQLHHRERGHYPDKVWRRQVAGQPRVLARFCGECGREIQLD